MWLCVCRTTLEDARDVEENVGISQLGDGILLKKAMQHFRPSDRRGSQVFISEGWGNMESGVFMKPTTVYTPNRELNPPLIWGLHEHRIDMGELHRND